MNRSVWPRIAGSNIFRVWVPAELRRTLVSATSLKTSRLCFFLRRDFIEAVQRAGVAQARAPAASYAGEGNAFAGLAVRVAGTVSLGLRRVSHGAGHAGGNVLARGGGR
jgi:hypothetical protein